MLKKVNKFIKGKEMLCCVICFFLGFIVCKMMNNIEGMGGQPSSGPPPSDPSNYRNYNTSPPSDPSNYRNYNTPLDTSNTAPTDSQNNSPSDNIERIANDINMLDLEKKQELFYRIIDLLNSNEQHTFFSELGNHMRFDE